MASQDWFDKDFYRILGVAKDVDDAELKKTYRKLARTYHPDSNQGDAAAEAKFKEISEAYSVLSDPEQRKEYDQIRAMGSGARFTAGGQSAGGFEDVFSMFGQGRGGRGDDRRAAGGRDPIGREDGGYIGQARQQHRGAEKPPHAAARGWCPVSIGARRTAPEQGEWVEHRRPETATGVTRTLHHQAQ